MRAFPAALERLTEQFARLPGVGSKTAQRLAFHVLSLPIEDAEEFAAAGREEVFPGEVFARHAHVHPRTRHIIEEWPHLLYLRLRQAIGHVAAVALVPALMPAVVDHADVALHHRNVQHAHCSVSSRLTRAP